MEEYGGAGAGQLTPSHSRSPHTSRSVNPAGSLIAAAYTREQLASAP